MYQIMMFMSLLQTIVAFTCDFEDESCPWNTVGNKGFEIQKAKDGRTKGFPSADTTERTEEGHYALAVEDKGYGPSRIMLSPCFGSSGPGCYLEFSYVVHGLSSQESMTMIIQNNCSPTGAMKEMGLIRNQQIKGWQKHTVNISEHQDRFHIVLFAEVPMVDSFIALDDITVGNCHLILENDTKTGCGTDEFRCPSSLCISNDRVCNLHHDCLDGEDETLPECDQMPESGRSTFENCDYQSGRCGWHNIQSDDFDWVLGTGAAPSKMGPSHDHTTEKYDKSGHYVYMQSSGQSTGNIAILESSVFRAPPFSNGQCKVRFFYHMYGKHVFRLQLDVREVCREANVSRTIIWNRFRRVKRNEWVYYVVPLVNISGSFVLRFTAFVGYLTEKGDIAVDDISLSPECFSSDESNLNLWQKSPEFVCPKAYAFNSCGAQGAQGPNQKLCDLTYDEELDVQVIESGPFTGVQVWTVQETSVYSITAVGARGGLGAQNRKMPQHGAYVHAKVNFTKGEKVYILIGQPGGSACSKVSLKDHPDLQKHCLLQPVNKTNGALVTSKIVKSLIGGGGGGGGATVVFKIDNVTNLPVVLVVAGGGGGLPSFSPTNSTRLSTNTLNLGHTLRAGAGGSINASDLLIQDGGSLLNLAVGGQLCRDDLLWETTGGFGGGGGPCLSGGGGGGFIGGRSNKSDNPYNPGNNGTSYAIKTATEVDFIPGIGTEIGWVEIVLPKFCPCTYYCIWDDITLNKYHCLCSSNTTLDADGIHCIATSSLRQKALAISPVAGLQIGQWIAIFLPVAILIILVTCLLIVYTRRNRKTQSNLISLDRIMTNRQNGNVFTRHRGRQTTASNINHTTAVMQFNPNYDVVIAKCPEQQLKELPRRHLKLTSLLGHGAFGEVYRGTLATGCQFTEILKVAVKTLPALCTDQTELDFLMEAVILSKFNHPNIVKLIGVCFESHPRYIILEVLEGGDLKLFLRESRPTATRCPDLTIRDLLGLCLDIAQACHHLEDKHFIHRDIAARNCLLTTKGPLRKAKIADFGMARDIYRSDYYKKAGKALLPVKWMPPEAFLDGIFTAKTDIWSYGILLWEIFSLGHMPYPGCSNEEVMQSVTMGGRLTPPEGCPAAVYEIMNYCWSGLAEERPTFSTLVSSVEKCLEDDDVASRGLPAFYQPAVPGTQGLRLPHSPVSTTLSAVHSGVCLDTSSNYLEPLIPLNAPISGQDDFSTSDSDESCDPEANHRLLGKSSTQVTDLSEASVSMESDLPVFTSPISGTK